MERIRDMSKTHDRIKHYYQDECPYCSTIFAWEDADMWPLDGETIRVKCPYCKMHVVMDVTHLMCCYITEDMYNNSITDTSKSGLEMLMEEKKKEDEARAAVN